MLDTSQQCKLKTEFFFIEPYPQRLQSLLRPEDEVYTHIIAQPYKRRSSSF